MTGALRSGVRRTGAVLGGLLFVVFNHASPAVAQDGSTGIISACVQQSSRQVRIVEPGEACRENEAPVQWNLAGSPGGTTLVDSQGQTIGTLTGCCTVLIRTATGPALFSVSVMGFQSNGELYFEEHASAGCAGTAFVRAVGVFSANPVNTATGIANYATSFEPRTMQSQTFRGAGCFETLIGDIFGPAMMLDLSGHTPPFSPQ